jgi:adenosylcobinamide amidohydrolase
VGSPELVGAAAGGRPVLVWRFPRPLLAVSSAPVGGGIGVRHWVLDAEVPRHYDRHDLHAHVAELAAACGCRGPGVGMLTAASVAAWRAAGDGGVEVAATVGVSRPTWAAGPDGTHGSWRPGTINVVAHVPVRLTPAALVNAVMTASEAKAQALLEAGVPGTGTASDALCITCPPGGPAEPFAGPRSPWGARLARAVHAAVGAGLR